MSIQKLLSKLVGVKQTGKNRWMARCPAHSDRTASLSIAEHEKGYILCNCFAGCDINQVLESVGLGLNDLFEQRLPDRLGQRPHLQFNEVLILIKREVMVVAMCGSRRMNKQLSEKDHDRLFTAVSRINEALNKAGVRLG